MKKFLLIAFLATIGTASAETWKCHLRTELNGTNAGLFIGQSELSGTGRITCVHTTEPVVVRKNIATTMSSGGLGIGYTEHQGSALWGAEIMVANVDDLLGEFDISSWGGMNLLTYARQTKIYAVNDLLELELCLSGAETAGLSLSAFRSGTLTIEEIEEE